MAAFCATQIALRLNSAAMQLLLAKKKHLEKCLWFLRSNQAKFFDLVDIDVSKNTGKKRQKAMQRRKDTK